MMGQVVTFAGDSQTNAFPEVWGYKENKYLLTKHPSTKAVAVDLDMVENFCSHAGDEGKFANFWRNSNTKEIKTASPLL